MSAYDTYLQEETEAAKKQNEEYAKRQKASLDAYLNELEAQNQQLREQAQQTYLDNVSAMGQDYAALFDKNAVSERVARRSLEEAMANMGLTDSGLNRTQQTVLSVQRARSDGEVQRQRQAAADSLRNQLNEYLAKNSASLAVEKARLTKDYQDWVSADLESLLSQAQQNAASRYQSTLAAAAMDNPQPDTDDTPDTSGAYHPLLTSERNLDGIAYQLQSGSLSVFELARQLQGWIKGNSIVEEEAANFIYALNIAPSLKIRLAKSTSDTVYRLIYK